MFADAVDRDRLVETFLELVSVDSQRVIRRTLAGSWPSVGRAAR
jgi:hypothetical protein